MSHTHENLQDKPDDLEQHKQKIRLQRQTEDARSPWSYSVKFDAKKEPKDSTMFLLANTNPLQQVLQYWVCQRTCRVCISLSFYCIVYLLLPLCFFSICPCLCLSCPFFAYISFLPNPLSPRPFLLLTLTLSLCLVASGTLFLRLTCSATAFSHSSVIT